MANELQVRYQTGKTIYFIIRNSVGQPWNTLSSAFENYTSADLANYTIAGVEQGSSGFYTGNFPSSILAGIYSVIANQQVGGSPAESDPTVGNGNVQWNGSKVLPESDLATSGQVGQIAPIRLARNWMVQNFPIYLKSSVDHVTPFTSGVISGQISKDGGNFGALQSGAFLEIGLGYYSLQALTSGDLNANTVALLFNGQGVSGGASDPLPMSFVLQRTSGF